MAQKHNRKVLITGASGLLGRSLCNKFNSEKWEVYGIALNRVQNNIHKLDITIQDDVRKTIEEVKPNVILHAAAQRFPDKVESDPEGAKTLNVEATKYVVEAAAEIGVPVIYISTDYVFDGVWIRPFTVNDKPNPINLYGKTKLEGELITLKHKGNIVLRVPVLYGPVMALSESAVTCLLEPLFTKEPVQVSHLERRCPSHVDDIALICFQLAQCLENKSLSGIYQWCGEEKMTKYEMLLRISEVFKLPHGHVKPVKAKVSGIRPMDTEMDRSKLTQLGFGQHTPFCKGIVDVLSTWVSMNCDLLALPYQHIMQSHQNITE